MREKLIQAFTSVKDKELSGEYIEAHTDLMWDVPEIPLIRAVPLYMLWCVEHIEEEGSLVFENTITALNKYARAKDSSIAWQDYMFSCNDEQVETTREFLFWCKNNLVLKIEPMLSRAIKNWEGVNKKTLT